MTYGIYYYDGDVTLNEKTGVYFSNVKLLSKVTVNDMAELNRQINLISVERGYKREYIHTFILIDRAMVENLYKLLDYCYDDEKKDLQCCEDETNHIFHVIKSIARCINYRGMDSIDTPLPMIDDNYKYKKAIDDIEKFLNEMDKLMINEDYVKKYEESAYRSLDNLKEYFGIKQDEGEDKK